MILCHAYQISKTIGANKILENLSFEIKENDRIGLVGRNGSGKTTLFKLLSGYDSPDTGEIHLQKGAQTGYLAQLPEQLPTSTVKDILEQAFSEVITLNIQLKELEEKMTVLSNGKDNLSLLNKYGILQEKFNHLGGYEIESELTAVTNGLKITHLLTHPFQELSGGEQTKVGLCKILLEKPDILLLDEPTNHLDIEAVEWLENYILDYRGAVVMISHDRYFLDRTVNKIAELEDQQITTYTGNYSSFLKQKEENLLAQFAQYKEQQKKIKKMEAAVKQMRDWANRANNDKMFRRAASMQKAIDRIEKIERPRMEQEKLQLDFEVEQRSSKEVFLLEKISKTFSESHAPLLNEISLQVLYQERIALIGSNGSGKSTLLKILLGEIHPTSGYAKRGINAKIGYLSQHLFEYQGQTILEAFRENLNITDGVARHKLAKYYFYGNDVFKKVSTLSGGEQIRLQLAKLMQRDINVLVLDEPTNHLDIESSEALEEAIEQFNGSIVCVSHDRYLLNKCFPITYWLEDGHIIKYHGNYDYARNKRSHTKSDIQTSVNPKLKKTNQRESNKYDSNQDENVLEKNYRGRG